MPTELDTILHVNDKLTMDGKNPSSVCVLFGSWARELSELGFRVVVATLRKDDPGRHDLLDRGISVHCLGPSSRSPGNARAIARLANDSDTRLLHLHGFGGSNFGRLAARKIGLPTIVHEHAVLRVPIVQSVMDRWLRPYTNAAVAVSQNVRDFMIEHRHIDAEIIRVIDNGIDLDRYRDVDPDGTKQLKRELHLEDAPIVIGTIARLREEKGVRYLIEAAVGIKRQIPGVRILVAGDGPQREELEALARSRGVDNVVEFLGFRSDVPQLLATMDVCVIPSLSEGFPLALVEAMASGKAIVASRVGGVKEVGVDGQNVCLTTPGDPNELQKKVVEIALDEAARRRISETAARDSVRYSVKRSAREVAALYHTLL